MDGLTFIDHLIGHLIWPIAVIGVIVFLSLRHRTAINALIPRIRKAKAGLFELELAEAKASADRAELPPPARLVPSTTPNAEPAPPMESEPPEELHALFHKALLDPRGAVTETYLFVNRYVLEASERLDPERTRYTDGSPAVMRAAVLTLFSPKQAEVLDRLRNAALRALDPDEDISPGEAIDYVLLATRLVGYISVRLELLPEAKKDPE